VNAPRSVLESEEAGNASLNPEVWILVAWELKIEDEVGGVTSRRKRTVTREHLVKRAEVKTGFWHFTVLNRHEVDHGELDEKLLGVTFCEHLLFRVPLATFKVDTVGVHTRLWLLTNILPAHVRLNDVREADLIDSDGVLTGEILLRTSEEGLREEEARDPEDVGGALVEPVGQELDTVVAIDDPRGQWLHTEEALAFTLVAPQLWHLVIEDGL